MAFYVGDPCYVIPDRDWAKFCAKMFDNEEFESGVHYHGHIEWGLQDIEIWSNGGDGTWTFSGIPKSSTLNNNNEFCVDAGIFCVINIEKLEQHYENNPTKGWDGFNMERTDSLIFKEYPTLEVKDYVVYINDVPDDSRKQCEGCEMWCENGSCIGCWMCLECDCEGDEE